MAARPADPRLAHRGVVLVEPALLPALVPGRWEEAGDVGGVRIVQAGGGEGRLVTLAPAAGPMAAARTLAQAGAAALVYVGACASPTRALEPGDVLVVERARLPGGEHAANAALATKFTNRGELRGLRVRRGGVASGGAGARTGELAQDRESGGVLWAAEEARVPAVALLVCEGPDPGTGSEAPGAVLEAFDRVFGLLEEILGGRRPSG